MVARPSFALGKHQAERNASTVLARIEVRQRSVRARENRWVIQPIRVIISPLFTEEDSQNIRNKLRKPL